MTPAAQDGEGDLSDGYEWVPCPGPYPWDPPGESGSCNRCGQQVAAGQGARTMPHHRAWQVEPPPTPAAQDGEGLVTEEIVERARRAHSRAQWEAASTREGIPGTGPMMAALVAVAPDIAAQSHDAARRLVEDALHLRTVGERAPGGTETWADWDRRAEAFLRGPA